MADITRRQNGGQMQQIIPSTFEPFRAMERMMRDLMRWEPMREMGLMRGMGEGMVGFQPSFDVMETEKSYVIKADVPGVKEKDLDISLHGNRLQISGTRQSEREEKTETFHAIERSHGNFVRSFVLPEEVDADKINADLKEGVLILTLPKREASQVKHIEVKAAQHGKS